MIDKPLTRSAGLGFATDQSLSPVWQTKPLDADERRIRMAALGQRIAKYVELMCQTAQSEGSSAEAQEKAVALFYEKLLAVERQLARIHDAFRLV